MQGGSRSHPFQQKAVLIRGRLIVDDPAELTGNNGMAKQAKAAEKKEAAPKAKAAAPAAKAPAAKAPAKKAAEPAKAKTAAKKK